MDSLAWAPFLPTPHQGWGSTMVLLGIHVVEPKCSYPVSAILPALFRALYVASHRKRDPGWQTLKEMYWLGNWKSRVVTGSGEAWSTSSHDAPVVQVFPALAETGWLLQCSLLQAPHGGVTLPAPRSAPSGSRLSSFLSNKAATLPSDLALSYHSF